MACAPPFFMTFNLLFLNEFPDEEADRAGGRRNLVLLLGRRTAGLLYAAMAVATPLWILGAVIQGTLPPICLVATLPFRFCFPAVRWAVTSPNDPVPIPCLAGNVSWNLLTNATLAIALGVATWLKL
jgi:1,4-dihydroxy-2-naphthoate octaprenyltransferase